MIVSTKPYKLYSTDSSPNKKSSSSPSPSKKHQQLVIKNILNGFEWFNVASTLAIKMFRSHLAVETGGARGALSSTHPFGQAHQTPAKQREVALKEAVLSEAETQKKLQGKSTTIFEYQEFSLGSVLDASHLPFFTQNHQSPSRPELGFSTPQTNRNPASVCKYLVQ